MYNSKNYKAMADKSTEKERMFNEWFTKSYNRLRTSLRKYGIPDEDNFHDTYLFVRKQVMAPGKDITFYEAQFSFKALAECMGISAAAVSQKVCRIVDAVRTHGSFAWRSQMLAVESFMY